MTDDEKKTVHQDWVEKQEQMSEDQKEAFARWLNNERPDRPARGS